MFHQPEISCTTTINFLKFEHSPIPNELPCKLSDFTKSIKFTTLTTSKSSNFHEIDQNWRNRQFWQFRLGFIKDLETLKSSKLTILAIFDQNQLNFTLLSRIVNFDMYLSTFVDDSVDIRNILKTTNLTKITNFDRNWPLLINSDNFYSDLSVYILVYTH